MATYKELLAQQKVLEDAINAAHAHERGAAITAAKEILEAFGLMEEDVFGIEKAGKTRKASNAKGGTVAAKYKDPQSGKTWSGRGKSPLWIAGKNRESFAI